jgi:chromosomal replication initiation ATPase DnaA
MNTEGLTKPGPSAEAHIQCVMQEYHLTRSELIGPVKLHKVMPARRELFIRLLCTPQRWVYGVPQYRSLPQVGKLVGKRDHTTALYNMRRYAMEFLGLGPKASVAEIRGAVHALESVLEAAA